MRSRNSWPALAALVVLSVAGVAAIVSAPRWRPPTDADAGQRRAFVIGIFEDPSARNPWARYGPNATVWNRYVAAGAAPSLFTYTTHDDWIPRLAEDFPTPLVRDDFTGLWRSTVHLRRDQYWNDGTPITARDVAFTYATIARFGATKLGGNIATAIAPEDLVGHVDALDEFTVEFFLKKRDARYRFGMLTGPIVQRGYWEPHVKAALASSDPLNAILNVDVVDEPVAGAFLQGTWERGAFVDRPANRRFSDKNSRQDTFANGAVRLHGSNGRSWTGYGDPVGAPAVSAAIGPHVDGIHYRVFGTQAAGVLALQSGQVSLLLNSLGLEKGFQDQLQSQPGISVIKNANNGIRYMGFNVRREPMRRLPFRQAVATLIDREFVTDQVLQGVARRGRIPWA